MGTFFHKLKPNKTSHTPRNWVLFDTEARIKVRKDGSQVHTLRLGVGLYRRDGYGRNLPLKTWFDYKRPRDFWSRVINQSESDRRLILLGYNVGYDLRLVDAFTVLAKMGYELTRIYIGQGAKIIQWVKDRHSILCLDAMNYLDGSLDTWGKMLKLPKVEVDFYNCTDTQLRRHCRRDVEILDKVITFWREFIEANDLGCFSVTRSSQAFTAFRHRFMDTPIYIHANKYATKIERDSYHGGRVECFHIGVVSARRIWSLDVNSLYPWIMSKMPVPIKLVNYVYQGTLARLERAIKRYALIARVLIDTPEPAFPLVHYGKLIYPTGRFEAVLTTPELKYAIERDYVKRVADFAQYDQDIIFNSYVKYMYQLRLKYKRQGNDIYQKMVKYLMNSLYGKFGQRAEIWEQEPCHSDTPDGVHKLLDGLTGEWYRVIVIAGQRWRVTDSKESFNSFPAVASHITSGARMYLWKLINAAGRKNVFYCDTDSLFVNSSGFKRLERYIDPRKLGKLKVKEVLKRFEVFAPKDYRTDKTRKTKGVARNAVQIDDNTFKQFQWQGLRGAIGIGKTSQVILTPVIKHLKRIYDRGRVHPDGSVSPWTLS